MRRDTLQRSLSITSGRKSSISNPNSNHFAPRKSGVGSEIQEISTKLMKQSTNQIPLILSKEPAERKMNELLILLQATKDVGFFQKLTQDHGSNGHLTLCQIMRYETKWQGEYVFQYGDNPDKFYVVLSGLVGVMIPTIGDAKAGSTQARSQIDNEVKIFSEVAEIGPGGSFGELALIKRAEKRAASIVCKEDTDFLTIDSESFRNILGKDQESKIKDNVSLMYGLPMFSFWTRTALERLSYSFTEKEYKRNQKVFKEGGPGNEIILIKSGEFRLFKTIPITKSSLHNEKLKRQTKIQKMLSAQRSSQPPTFQGEITSLSKGQMFGDEDALIGQPRQFTCIWSSLTGVILSVPVEEFYKRVASQETFGEMKKHADARKRFLQDRVSKIEQFGATIKSRSDNSLQQKTKIEPETLFNKHVNAPTQYMNPNMMDLSTIPHYSKVKESKSKPNFSPREKFTPTMMRSIGDLTARSMGKSQTLIRNLKTPEPKVTNIHTNAMRKKAKAQSPTPISTYKWIDLKSLFATYDSSDPPSDPLLQSLNTGRKLDLMKRREILGKSTHNLFRKKRIVFRNNKNK